MKKYFTFVFLRDLCFGQSHIENYRFSSDFIVTNLLQFSGKSLSRLNARAAKTKGRKKHNVYEGSALKVRHDLDKKGISTAEAK